MARSCWHVPLPAATVLRKKKCRFEPWEDSSELPWDEGYTDEPSVPRKTGALQWSYCFSIKRFRIFSAKIEANMSASTFQIIFRRIAAPCAGLNITSRPTDLPSITPNFTVGKVQFKISRNSCALFVRLYKYQRSVNFFLLRSTKHLFISSSCNMRLPNSNSERNLAQLKWLLIIW